MSIRSFQSPPWPSSGGDTAAAIEALLGITSGNVLALANLSGTNTGDQTLPTLTSLGAVPTSRQVNGKALSANITLDCDDLSDGTNTHLVTTAQKTVIGNTSGTNTGDYNNIYNSTANGTTGSITPVVSSSTAGKPLTSTYEVTAAANALTINVPSGTPNAGDQLLLTFLDNGTARTITWTLTAGGYAANPGFALPTTTVISTLLMAKFLYRADGLWHCMAVA